MGKGALVVRRDILFGNNPFDGFLVATERDFLNIILNNYYYHERGEELENNSDLQQIIPYIWIVNPLEKKVFLYRRKPSEKPKGEFQETRYLNKYSGGVGGHIDKDKEGGSSDPIIKGMMRELQEEVEFVGQSYPEPKIFGYLNDDRDEIGKVHFGIVAIAETTAAVRAKEETEEGAFYSIGEVDRLFADTQSEIEGWTEISWPYVREYLNFKA